MRALGRPQSCQTDQLRQTLPRLAMHTVHEIQLNQQKCSHFFLDVLTRTRGKRYRQSRKTNPKGLRIDQLSPETGKFLEYGNIRTDCRRDEKDYDDLKSFVKNGKVCEQSRKASRGLSMLLLLYVSGAVDQDQRKVFRVPGEMADLDWPESW